MIERISLFLSFVTAFGIVYAALGFNVSKRQAEAEYERQYLDHYREITQQLPADFWLDESVLSLDDFIPGSTHKKVYDVIYHYLELCNDQILQRRKKLISTKTWIEWQDGIRFACTNIPQVVSSLDKIQKNHSGFYSELSKFLSNPSWDRSYKKR